MRNRKLTYWDYFWKTFKWFIGNALFGVFPLVFMCIIYYLSEKKLGGHEIEKLVYDGAVLFVCIAMVGAVLVDYYLSGFRATGFGRFAIYAFPSLILMLISVNYFLIHIKVIDNSRFSITSNTTIWTVAMSFIYILFVKTNLYIKEDVNHEPAL